MTCIIDSLFYKLLVHVCLFHALYCDVVNSGDGGVRGGANNNFHLMKGGVTHIFLMLEGGVKHFFRMICKTSQLSLKVYIASSLNGGRVDEALTSTS